MSWKPNPNIENIINKALQEGLSDAADVLEDGVKRNLSGPQSRSKLNRQTGKLKKSIDTDKTKLDRLEVRVGTDSPYANINEFGGVIRAKRAESLRFKINDMWRTMKSVIIPARPFFRSAIKSNRKKMLKQFKNKL